MTPSELFSDLRKGLQEIDDQPSRGIEDELSKVQQSLGLVIWGVGRIIKMLPDDASTNEEDVPD